MSENIKDHKIEEEIEDTRTFEEKFKDFVEKIKPYKERFRAIRKKFLIVNLVVLLLALAYLLFFAKPYFESTVTVLPEYGSKSNMLSQLSGLAELAGVKVGETAPTEIYQKLIYSETVLQDVIYAKYKTDEFPYSVNLIQYFEIDESDNNPVIQKRKNFLKLFEVVTKGRISTEVDRMTKILNVTVTMPEAQLSADVANKLVEALDLYIRTQRKSYATEQSYYLDKRTTQIKDSLNIAENKLKIFREQNRITSQSPNLLLEQGRLMRDVEILQTVFIELTKQLEIAKIDQIKDAPVLNIKEYAKNPVKKAGPKRASSLIIIMFFSSLLSGLYFIFKQDFKNYYKILKG
ncbi:MAG TPA: Wzz/FepE/Etk N-terminal domain-containing protein [Ignavibacteriaceae bacterium]|nr:Wzz/FepE/Etk N-terminal domain-containing protein [Ignavibacteriaceae bacterium]